MIKVTAKPFRSHFGRPRLVELDHIGFPRFHSYRHWFNPFAFYIFATGLFLLGGIFQRTSLIVGLTLITCGVYLYFSARRLAMSLALVRHNIKKQWVETEVATVVVEVRNQGGLSVQGLVVEDHFGPSLKSKVRWATSSTVLPFSRLRFEYTRPCDGGMGTHCVGPLEVTVSDALGVFQFRVFDDEELEVEVLPKVEHLPGLMVKGSPLSPLYGYYDVAQRGFSVNFSGIRPYSPGDSLRHLAWRLSARTGTMLVKEFERAVNSEVTLVVDLNPDIHLGVKSQSTWEYARDVSLGLLSQQLEMNNSVRLISNHFFSEMGRGEDHLHYLCHEVAQWDPQLLSDEPELMRWGHSGELLRRTAHLLRSGSTLIYLTPYQRQEFGEAREVLKSLWGEGVEVFVVFIDVNSFVGSLVKKLGWINLAEVASCRGVLDEIRALARMGIASYQICSGEPLGRGFFKDA